LLAGRIRRDGVNRTSETKYDTTSVPFL